MKYKAGFKLQNFWKGLCRCKSAPLFTTRPLRWKWRHQFPAKYWYPSVTLHGV